MTANRVIVVCNALDDETRLEREISTDSPAASRKVFHLCIALRHAGVQACVLSLGRGRAGGSTAFFPSQMRRVQGIPVIYAPFSKRRGISELISLFALAAHLLRLKRRSSTAVIFYNRELAYAPSLLVAACKGWRCILDLEDGELSGVGSRWSRTLSRGMCQLYDRLCSGGALLACSALSAATSIRPVFCYYGVAEASEPQHRWRASSVRAVLSGTLSPETGVDLLIRAIELLRRTRPDWARALQIEVTGKGPSLPALLSLAQEDASSPAIVIHGRISDQAYRQVVARCEIGLALKPRSGPLAQTTFPSKVIEFASADMLVITTDISDVRTVLGDGALYLTRDDPSELVELMRLAVERRADARDIAGAGWRAAWNRCAPEAAGIAVRDFVFGRR